MLSGEGKAHRVGTSAFNLYIPAKVASDSVFPWCEAESGSTTRIEVLDEAVLILGDSTEELSERQRQEISAILKHD